MSGEATRLNNELTNRLYSCLAMVEAFEVAAQETANDKKKRIDPWGMLIQVRYSVTQLVALHDQIKDALEG